EGFKERALYLICFRKAAFLLQKLFCPASQYGAIAAPGVGVWISGKKRTVQQPDFCFNAAVCLGRVPPAKLHPRRSMAGARGSLVRQKRPRFPRKSFREEVRYNNFDQKTSWYTASFAARI